MAQWIRQAFSEQWIEPKMPMLCKARLKLLSWSLQAHPELASGQDAHGYALMHAATSCDQADLPKALVPFPYCSRTRAVLFAVDQSVQSVTGGVREHNPNAVHQYRGILFGIRRLGNIESVESQIHHEFDSRPLRNIGLRQHHPLISRDRSTLFAAG